AVGLPQHLDPLDTGDGQLRKVEAAADVIGSYSVDEDLREIRFTTAQAQRGRAAPLTDLDDLRRGNQAKSFEHVEFVDRLYRRFVDHGDRRATTSLQLLGGARVDDNVLLQRSNVERHFEAEGAPLADEDGVARLRLEARHAHLHLIAVGGEAAERKRS